MDTNDTTRDRILIASGPIFARKGFRGATIREISDAAGVNLASVNYYFGDKQQLYTEAVIMARQMRVQEVPDPQWSSDTPACERLRDFIRILLNRLVALQSEPWQVRLLMREMLQPTDACRQLVRDYFRPFFDLLLGVVDEIVGVELPNYKRRQIGFSIVGQILHYRFAADITSMFLEGDELDSHFNVDDLTEHIFQFSYGALKKIEEEHGESLNQSCSGSNTPK